MGLDLAGSRDMNVMKLFVAVAGAALAAGCTGGPSFAEPPLPQGKADGPADRQATIASSELSDYEGLEIRLLVADYEAPDRYAPLAEASTVIDGGSFELALDTPAEFNLFGFIDTDADGACDPEIDIAFSGVWGLTDSAGRFEIGVAEIENAGQLREWPVDVIEALRANACAQF